MSIKVKSRGTTRRGFLQTAGLAGAALAASLWLPRRARGAAPPGSVRRAIIINAPGAPRWSASFDGQADVKRNPWGVLPWSLVGRGAAPEWGFSRMLVQKPLNQNAVDWPGTIYPYLTTASAAAYNVTQPQLKNPAWKGALLPTFADVAGDVAVVRVTGNPGAQFDGDHASASHTLYTGFRSGQVGLATAIHHAMKLELGSAFDSAYALPAVSVGQPAWSFGIGDYAASRPIFLTGATALPTVDPGKSVAPFGRASEKELDAAFQAARQAFMGQSAADFINDKVAGDAHVSQLVHPALRLATVPAMGLPSPVLGTLLDGSTPVSNDMLNEVFGNASDIAPVGDITFDAFGALQSSLTPTWKLGDNAFGLNGALAVRLLQMGAPLVSLSVGSFDTHSYEVIDPQAKHPQTVQTVLLARMIASLEFALKNIADPTAPGHSLFETTVIFCCSEFGRGGTNVGANGFNSPNGQNDGGSDHDPWCAWPMLGGPVVAGGKLLLDGGAGGFHHQNRVFTTLLKAMGVEDANSQYLPYAAFPPIPGLLQGV